MQSITRGIALLVLTGMMMAGAPAYDLFADEPAPSPTVADPTLDEPAMTTPEPEGFEPPSDTGEVQERGFGSARLPQSSVPGRESPVPINAGTPSLTTIANLIRVTHKSVSIYVDVPAGLSLPVAVEISARFAVYGYSSPELKGIAGFGGVHLVHHMPDKPMIPGGGSGPLAHKVMVYLTLRETDQTARSFSFPTRQMTITPLYDINLSNLTFQLVKECDSWIRGKSDIYFDWKTPDDRMGRRIFKLDKGMTQRVPEFDWFTRQTQQVNLFEPRFKFAESDSPFALIDPNVGHANRLLPVVAGRHRAELEVKEERGQCTAKIAYTIFRKLRTF